MAETNGENTNKDDIAFIKALTKLLQDNDLGELKVRRQYGAKKELSVHIMRSSETIQPSPQPAAPPLAPIAQAAPAPAPAPSQENAAASGEDFDIKDPSTIKGAITSPMIGTVYLAPEPGASAFVSVGDRVSKGQTLLIVEAMKTMNHIAAPHDGVVQTIFVDDSAPVEYGALLMIIA